MTKWEYKIVEIRANIYDRSERITSVHIDGVDVGVMDERHQWHNYSDGGERHKALNELGKEGWELIKTRSKFQNRLEILYFKRPL